MGWSTLPAVAGTSHILAANFDELRAAILERAAAVEVSLSPTDISEDGVQPWAVLTEYRGHIETLIPHYYKCRELTYYMGTLHYGKQWNKARLLQATINAADWSEGGVGTPMLAAQVNELHAALNGLEALAPVALAGTVQNAYVEGATGINWAQAWTNAKAVYPGTYYSDWNWGIAGVRTHNDEAVIKTSIRQMRVPDLSVALPAIPGGFGAAKSYLLHYYVGRATMDVMMDIYPEANFVGTPTLGLCCPQDDTGYWGYVSTEIPGQTPGATIHLSTRDHPHEYSSAELDNFKPSEGYGADGGGWGDYPPSIMQVPAFEYTG